MIRRVSPSRRLLFQVITLVSAVLAAFLVVGHLTSSTPQRRQGVAQDLPGRVLLVPGYGGSTTGLEVLAAKLTAVGRQVAVIGLPGDGTGDLRDSARVLDAATVGATSVDVVGTESGDGEGAGKSERAKL